MLTLSPNHQSRSHSTALTTTTPPHHHHSPHHHTTTTPPQDGRTLANELDVVEGMKFDRGYISPYFVTDNKTQVVEFEKPLILLCEKRISNLAQMIPLLEGVVKSQRPLLIIAEDVESEALATLVRTIQNLKNTLLFCSLPHSFVPYPTVACYSLQPIKAY